MGMALLNSIGIPMSWNLPLFVGGWGSTPENFAGP